MRAVSSELSVLLRTRLSDPACDLSVDYIDICAFIYAILPRSTPLQTGHYLFGHCARAADRCQTPTRPTPWFSAVQRREKIMMRTCRVNRPANRATRACNNIDSWSLIVDTFFDQVSLLRPSKQHRASAEKRIEPKSLVFDRWTIVILSRQKVELLHVGQDACADV